MLMRSLSLGNSGLIHIAGSSMSSVYCFIFLLIVLLRFQWVVLRLLGCTFWYVFLSAFMTKGFLTIVMSCGSEGVS